MRCAWAAVLRRRRTKTHTTRNRRRKSVAAAEVPAVRPSCDSGSSPPKSIVTLWPAEEPVASCTSTTGLELARPLSIATVGIAVVPERVALRVCDGDCEGTGVREGVEEPDTTRANEAVAHCVSERVCTCVCDAGAVAELD